MREVLAELREFLSEWNLGDFGSVRRELGID